MKYGRQYISKVRVPRQFHSTTYLVNGDGVIERIMGPKEIKTKIHAEQILEII